jgi:hypothetical protein
LNDREKIVTTTSRGNTGRSERPHRPTAERGPTFLAEWTRLRRKWVGPFLLALILANLASGVCWLGARMPARADLSYPEGAEIERAWAVSRGEPAYIDWRQWPHLNAPYGPLMYYPAGLAARWLPGKPTAWRVTLLGRGESLLALLGIGWLIYRLGRRMGLTPAWALAAVTANGSWISLLEYGASYRPDAPVSFLALAALAVMARGRARAPRVAWVLALLMAAMWYKPTSWGMVAVAALWMREGMGWRRAALWLGAWGATGLGAALALNAYWNGLLLLNVVDNVRIGWTLYFLERLAREIRQPKTWVIVLGAAASWRALRRGAGETERWVAIGALVTLATNLAMGLKRGSDINYFMTPFPLLALMLTHATARLWRESGTSSGAGWREALLWGALLPVALFLLMLPLATLREDFTMIVSTWRPSPVAGRLAEVRGPILTTMPFLVLETQSPPVPMDPFGYATLADRGMLDTTALKERIVQGAFAAIVLPWRHWEHGYLNEQDEVPLYFEGFVPLVRQHYVLAWRWKAYLVFEPRGLSPSRRTPGQKGA